MEVNKLKGLESTSVSRAGIDFSRPVLIANASANNLIIEYKLTNYEKIEEINDSVLDTIKSKMEIMILY